MHMHSATVTETRQEPQKTTRRRLTPAEQIVAAREALARAQRRQRSADTRSKVVLGGYVLAWVRSDPQAARLLLQRLNQRPPRAQDMDALEDTRSELMQISAATTSGVSDHANA